MEQIDRIDTSLDNKSLFKMLVIPVIIMMVFSSLLQIADRIIAAYFIGEDTLAAVTLIHPVLMLAISLAVMIVAGLGVEINYLLGKKEREKARGLASFITIFLFILSLLIMSALLIFKEQVIDLLVTTDKLKELASTYYVWIAYSFPPIALGYAISTSVVADGGAKHNMIGQMIYSLSNIALNALFVIVLDMGILGLGIGTTLAGILFSLWMASYFIFKRYQSFTFGKLYISIKELGRVAFNGSSEIFSHLSLAVLMLVINKVIETNLGLDIFVGYATAMIFITIFISIFHGSIFGSEPVISKAYGENNVSKSISMTKYTYLKALIIGTILFLIFIPLVKPLSSLFLESDVSIQATYEIYIGLGAVSILEINMIFAAGFLTGLKMPIRSLLCSIIRILFLLPIFITIGVNLFGQNGLWIGALISEIIVLPILIIIVISGIKKAKSKTGETNEIS